LSVSSHLQFLKTTKQIETQHNMHNNIQVLKKKKKLEPLNKLNIYDNM